MPNAPSMDRLTGQLNHLPGIILKLGLSVAGSQKALNLEYVRSLTTLVGLIRATSAPGKPGDAAEMAAIKDVLQAIAPPRYMFTETTLDFSADLAESLDVAGSASLGLGIQAVAISAAVSAGYGYDYRAAARITTRLHAYPVGADAFQKLLDRAKELDASKLALPERSQVEQALWDEVKSLQTALASKAPAAPANPGGGN